MEKSRGVTVIELLVVLAILSIFILVGVWAWKKQLMKSRDARRKVDLKKFQEAIEDYLGDKGCYPDSESNSCGASIVPDLGPPYLPEPICDPLNNSRSNYLYSIDPGESCKSWYKIYARLENEDDPIIEKVGCGGGCGPGRNYNYWVSSSNITQP